MVTTIAMMPCHTVDVHCEATWVDLYPSLRSIARRFVYSFQVSSWRGQEEDIIEDVVQETIRRIIKRAHQAERGEIEPICSLKHMMTTIAENYCKDLRRKELRLLHISPQKDVSESFACEIDPHGTLDAVTEKVFEESIFALLAHEIARFPAQQRNTLLIDLANRMCFNGEPTALQRAFLKEGIQLQRYCIPLPLNPKERSRHAANLSYAYQRLSRLPCIQAYIGNAPLAFTARKVHSTNYSGSVGRPASSRRVRHVHAALARAKKTEVY